MNARFEAAWELHTFLTEQHIPYVVIGGLAAQHWGDQRFTQDVDITIATAPEQGLSQIVLRLTQRFRSRVPDPVEFARSRRMILISAGNKVDVDISLALPGYEDELLARAVDFAPEAGKLIRLCTAEDLIIHKVVAGRPQDLSDVQSVVFRQGDKLDLMYIREWLRQFAEIMEQPELPARFESAWQKRTAI
jgi:Nucleotidyl transferase of unknown function (DUF2204)